MRRILVALAVATIALLGTHPAPAAAHGDVHLVDGPIEIGAGGSLRFEGQLHYHRLIGRIDTTVPVVVRLVREDGDVALEKRGTELVFNDLIRCCDDRGWTPYALVIENPANIPVTGYARATLAHDDLAVMVYGAESFTSESVVVFGGIWTLVMWRALRSPRPATTRRTLVPLAVVGAAALALTTYGAMRYGSGGVPAFLAALSDMSPVPANPIVSGSSLLVAATLGTWGFAARRWAIGHGVLPRPLWFVLGSALVGSVAVVAALTASSYGTAVMPIASGVAAGGPLLLAMAIGLARSRVAQSH